MDDYLDDDIDANINDINNVNNVNNNVIGSEIYHDLSLIRYSQFLYDLLCNQLPYKYLKVGFPLYSVYDTMLTANNPSLDEEQLTKQNLGLLQYISAIYNRESNQSVTGSYPNTLQSLSELKLDVGFPFLITKCVGLSPRQDEAKQGFSGKSTLSAHKYLIYIKRNSRFFHRGAVVAKQNHLSNIQYSREVIVSGQPMLSSLVWENLVQSYKSVPWLSQSNTPAQPMKNKIIVGNSSGTAASASTLSSSGSLLNGLIKFLLSPRDQVETQLQNLGVDKQHQSVELQAFLFNLQEARNYIFNGIQNPVHVGALIGAMLSVLGARGAVIHFPYIYCSFLGVRQDYLESASSSSEENGTVACVSSPLSFMSSLVCPIEQCIMTDQTYTLRHWLNASGDRNIPTRQVLSLLFQVCFALAYVQKAFGFVHHNLTIDNIGLMDTQNQADSLHSRNNIPNHGLYRWKKNLYLIPFYGKLVKLQNFTASSCVLAGKRFNSLIEPNFNLDLVRLGATLLPWVKLKVAKSDEIKLYDYLIYMITSWALPAYPLSLYALTEVPALPGQVQQTVQDIQIHLANCDLQAPNWHPFRIQSAEQNDFALPDNQMSFFECFEIDPKRASPDDYVFEMYRDADYIYNADLHSHAEARKKRYIACGLMNQWFTAQN